MSYPTLKQLHFGSRSLPVDWQRCEVANLFRSILCIETLVTSWEREFHSDTRRVRMPHWNFDTMSVTVSVFPVSPLGGPFRIVETFGFRKGNAFAVLEVLQAPTNRAFLWP